MVEGAQLAFLATAWKPQEAITGPVLDGRCQGLGHSQGQSNSNGTQNAGLKVESAAHYSSLFFFFSIYWLGGCSWTYFQRYRLSQPPPCFAFMAGPK